MIAENYVRAEHRSLFHMVGSIEEVLPTLEALQPEATHIDSELI